MQIQVQSTVQSHYFGLESCPLIYLKSNIDPTRNCEGPRKALEVAGDIHNGEGCGEESVLWSQIT